MSSTWPRPSSGMTKTCGGASGSTESADQMGGVPWRSGTFRRSCKRRSGGMRSCSTPLPCGCRASDEEEALAEFDGFLVGAASLTTPFVLVSDEVGLGVVPESEAGRRFRDLLGSRQPAGGRGGGGGPPLRRRGRRQDQVVEGSTLLLYGRFRSAGPPWNGPRGRSTSCPSSASSRGYLARSCSCQPTSCPPASPPPSRSGRCSSPPACTTQTASSTSATR